MSDDPQWILPTLQRPHNLARLVESYSDVGEEGASVSVLVYYADPFIDSYLAIELPPTWTLCVENFRFTATDAMRWLVKGFPTAQCYGFLGDDVVFRTKWWERLAGAAGDWCVSWPADGVQNEGLPTHFVCGGKLVRTVGYWALPGIVHSGVDLVWYVLGMNVRGLLQYCPDVEFEHMHPLVEKGEHDEIYQFARDALPKDSDVFLEWNGGTGLRDDVKLIHEAILNEQAA